MAMTPAEIEDSVMKMDEIRIVIRAPSNAKLGDYIYQRKAADNASVVEWLDQRIRPIVSGHDVVVIDGNGASPHGRTKLATLRATYEH